MKIRIPIRTHMSVENIRYFLALLCLSSYALLEHVSVSIPVFSPVKYILLYLAGICSIFEVLLVYRNIRKIKYFYTGLHLLLLIGTLFLSAYMNRNPVIGSSPVYGTVRLILYLVELFVMVIWTAESGRVEYVIRFLFRYLLILVAITDVVLLTRWLQFSSGGHSTYLLGTKFTVAYRHIELFALWLMCDRERFLYLRRKKRWVIPMAVFIVTISYVIDCMTGVLGIVGFLWLYLFVDKKRQTRIEQFSSPVVLGLALLCSAFAAFVIDGIVTNPIVEYVIEELLHRDTTLTGRVFIFNMFGKKMAGHWLFGFGFGNGNVAANWLFRYANAQNALLQWILQTGILAVMLLCLWMCRIFYQLHNSRAYRQITPIVVLLYVFVVLGTIETTFNMAFIFWFALILMHICETQTKGCAIV